MSKTSTRLTKGDLVEIRFLDHCEDGEDSMEFLVWGRVRNVTRTSYVVESWAYAHPSDDEVDDGSYNRKVFVIVKKAVLEAVRLFRAS